MRRPLADMDARDASRDAERESGERVLTVNQIEMVLVVESLAL